MAAGQDPRRARESSCIFQFSPAFPRGVTATHARYHSPGVCRALVVSNLQETASLPKGSAGLNAELKAPPHCAEHSNSLLTQQHSGMGTPLTAVLKLVHTAQFSQFFHCVIQRHVVFLSVQVNFSFFFFFPISRSPDP